jgi:hypothetical protein
MKFTLIMASAALLVLLAFNFVWGRGENDPRAVGMGGAFTALARGSDAACWNPANLGLSNNDRYSINLLDMGMRIRNNSFTLDDYNRYNGKFLTEADKVDIINSIPSTGLDLDLAAEASALNFSIGNLAVSYTAVGVTSFSLDRDPFRLMLLGNAVAHEVSVSDTRGEAYALGDFALSYGRTLWDWNDGEFSVGAGAHYIEGYAFAGITEADGGIITSDSSFYGSGQMAYRTSRGGTGYSSDLGLAVRFSESWFFSAVYQNISSRINWRKDNREYLMWFDMRPVTVESMFDQPQADSLVNSGDSSFAYHTFFTRLTPVVRLGLARQWQRVTWALDWEQNLFAGPGAEVSPRVSGGLEFSHWRRLPFRIGASFGGSQGSTYSIGMGAHFGAYNFDLGYANSGSLLPGHSQGERLALGMNLRF